MAFRTTEQTCGATGSLRYCAYRDERGTKGDIIHHLHGRDLDECIWNDDTYLTTLIQAERQRRRELPLTVVTLPYGSTWLQSPKGEKADSGLLDDLMARLPAIEARIGRPRRRLLMGESMGGLRTEPHPLYGGHCAIDAASLATFLARWVVRAGRASGRGDRNDGGSTGRGGVSAGVRRRSRLWSGGSSCSTGPAFLASSFEWKS